ncbi:LuxR C-terminal-related transcriptional regulator [Streptomyces sp. NBC_00133]
MGRWPLVGRDPYLQAFRQALMADQHCRGWMICGPAGVGKSRLAEECLDWAAREGHRTLRAMASTAAATVPLGAVAHILPPGMDLSDPVAGFDAVAREMASPGRGPVVILIDDLHLLDHTSATLLGQLVDAGLIFLIGTVRSQEAAGEVVAALLYRGDSITRVDLAGLEQPQVELLLHGVLGGPVGQRTLRRLFTTSRGNVLYLRELVIGAVQQGCLAHDGEAWQIEADRPAVTNRLRELINSRLTSVARGADVVLETLALCGTLSLCDAEAVAPAPSTLADIERAGLIRIYTESRRTFVTLAHPLYGEIVRSTLSTLRRQQLLLRQAARVDAYGGRRCDDALRTTAWRLAATGTADAHMLLHAAALAMHSGDDKQAVALLEALEPEHHTSQSLLMLGKALMRLGEYEKADEVLTEADEQAVGEREKVAAVTARGLNLYWMGVRTEVIREVNSAARTAVKSRAGREQLFLNEACLLVTSGRPAESLRLLASLADNPDGEENLDRWLLGANAKATGLAFTGRTEEAVTLARNAHAAHLEFGGNTLLSHSSAQLVPLLLAHTENGEFGECRKVGEHAVGELDSAEAPTAYLWLTFYLGRLEWFAGRPATARRWYAEAATLARKHRHLRFMRLYLSGWAASAAVLKDVATAEGLLAELEAYPDSGYLDGEDRLGEAWLHVARGQLTRAREVLEAAADQARLSGSVVSEVCLLTDLARLGAPQAVRGRLDELASVCDGAFTTVRASLAAALADGAPEPLMAAATALEAVGAHMLAAEAASTAAVAWRRLQQPRRAASATAAAAALATACENASTPILATIDDGIAPLTGREWEIALMAGTGASSRAIAEQLGVSVRTVDNHLHRIYTKLGITTRSELGRVLRQLP